jgi:predicted AlkP superfamily phosphohydrolase/phosphomutase
VPGPLAWDPAARLTTEMFSSACGRVKSKAPWEISPYYMGNHDPAAFLIAQGPGIRSGSVLDNVHVLDVAPTVLAYFGIDKTASMDGKVLSPLVPGDT